MTGLLNDASTAALRAGVLNSLTKFGDEVAVLVASPDIHALGYTGSTRVSRQIMANAAGTLKRLSLELGGKTPMIVLDDADLDTVVPVLTAAVTTFSGQFCMSGSRVLARSESPTPFGSGSPNHWSGSQSARAMTRPVRWVR